MKQKITNCFLTGPIRIGKSTVLNKILNDPLFNQLKIAGFKTIPINANGLIEGYALEIIDGQKKLFAHIQLATKEKFKCYQIDPSIFDNLGKEIVINHADIILMDEIGVIEKNASKFIDFLRHCLDSEKFVLGVYQQRAHWFFELIRDRKDTLIFEVTKTNRDTIHIEILEQLQKRINF